MPKDWMREWYVGIRSEVAQKYNIKTTTARSPDSPHHEPSITANTLQIHYSNTWAELRKEIDDDDEADDHDDYVNHENEEADDEEDEERPDVPHIDQPAINPPPKTLRFSVRDFR